MTIFIGIIMALLVMTFMRIIIGPSVWDRLLGLNLVSLKILVIIIMVALVQEESYLLDLALAYAFLGIIGVIFISRFIQRKGRI